MMLHDVCLGMKREGEGGQYTLLLTSWIEQLSDQQAWHSSQPYYTWNVQSKKCKQYHSIAQSAAILELTQFFLCRKSNWNWILHFKQNWFNKIHMLALSCFSPSSTTDHSYVMHKLVGRGTKFSISYLRFI